MRPSVILFAVSLLAEASLAAPVKAEALPLILLPREYKDFNKRTQPTAMQLAANGRPCGLDSKQGVCDNGRCGTFIAPSGFIIIRGAESQCGGVF
ncbi:uncharacterized protein CTRU02_213202 [Colletotrichum truncatum]|uniref:Uncharacterized protein n=1 Tax=Colletotrichum truncatum TaxID=5467 RepID=A0ACC3YK57_COLTU|nr:uncharacterized protein CTRU02_12581 [Colletotrichum truncatum]KAF6784319.1 hypothetical protein CTRU02_12581 [Colletotrichum truncatum]